MTTRSERMFVLGHRCIYLVDFLEMRSEIFLTCLDYEGADKAISEFQEMKDAMRDAQSERLFSKGSGMTPALAKRSFLIKGISDFFGFSFGQCCTNKQDWCVGKSKTAVVWYRYDYHTFRGLDKIELSLTWKSHLLFGVKLSGNGHWGGFSRAEEAENILNMLIEHFKVQPIKEETDHGVKHTFRIEDSVIELRCNPNGGIELDVRNIRLEELSTKEFDKENKEIMSKTAGKSAL